MGDFCLHLHKTLNDQVQFGTWTDPSMDVCGNTCWCFFHLSEAGIYCSFPAKRPEVRRWVGLNALVDAAVQPLPCTIRVSVPLRKAMELSILRKRVLLLELWNEF